MLGHLKKITHHLTSDLTCGGSLEFFKNQKTNVVSVTGVPQRVAPGFTRGPHPFLLGSTKAGQPHSPSFAVQLVGCIMGTPCFLASLPDGEWETKPYLFEDAPFPTAVCMFTHSPADIGHKAQVKKNVPPCFIWNRKCYKTARFVKSFFRIKQK